MPFWWGIICLQVKVLAYCASTVHIVMILKFTALMRAVYRYSLSNVDRKRINILMLSCQRIECLYHHYSCFWQMSAAAFAKGLLDLEGQLTPILVCSLFFGNFLLVDIELCWVGQTFSRFPLLARTPLCWMDLTMPALRWKKRRFVLPPDLFFAYFSKSGVDIPDITVLGYINILSDLSFLPFGGRKIFPVTDWACVHTDSFTVLLLCCFYSFVFSHVAFALFVDSCSARYMKHSHIYFFLRIFSPLVSHKKSKMTWILVLKDWNLKLLLYVHLFLVLKCSRGYLMLHIPFDLMP